ncbi:MAG: GAF domain-containing protein, partial [Anaerolineae bacterium]
GPGPMENSLVRFGLTAILWGALLIVAWSRQRNQDLPREKLLVWGFGLGFTSAVLMIAFVSLQMLQVIDREATYAVLVPLDRALAMASVVVVAGAFLRYILDDARLARGYLLAGLAATILCLMIALWQWPLHLDIVSEDRFHSTWGAWLFPVASSTLMVSATVLLRRKRGWLSNVVSIALLFFLVAEFLLLANYATDRKYSDVLCPIGNSFRILAIPLLGYVYLREQAIEKRRAEKALEAYRHRLEELVEERTAELTAVNAKLAAQNAVAATLSRSLEIETILDTALDVVLSVADMDVGLVFLWDPDVEELTLQGSRGQLTPGEAEGWSRYVEISAEAVAGLRAVIHPGYDPSGGHPGADVAGGGPEMLVSAPLVAKGRAVGALTLGSRRADPIQGAELELVTAIGQQIGMAIENAHLYLATERSAEMLTLLHQVSIVLTSTLDPAKIYDQIAEQSVKLLGCQMACVYAREEQEQGAELVSSYGMSEVDAHLLEANGAPCGCLQELITCQPSIAIEDAQN